MVRNMRALLILVCVFLSFSCGAFAAQGDALRVQRILERYADTLGGRRAVEALSSLSVEGTQIQDGKRCRFLMRKKRPGVIRYRLKSDDCTVVCGYNGRSGWQRIASGDEMTIEDLPEEQLAVLREEASFESPLFRHLEKPWNAITLIGNQSVGEHSVYVLEVAERGQLAARYYLDAGNSLLLKRDRLNPDGAVRLETFYRDYREVDGYRFAFEVENRVGDVQRSLVQVESIEVNPGLLRFYFEKPRS